MITKAPLSWYQEWSHNHHYDHGYLALVGCVSMRERKVDICICNCVLFQVVVVTRQVKERVMRRQGSKWRKRRGKKRKMKRPFSRLVPLFQAAIVFHRLKRFCTYFKTLVKALTYAYYYLAHLSFLFFDTKGYQTCLGCIHNTCVFVLLMLSWV